MKKVIRTTLLMVVLLLYPIVSAHASFDDYFTDDTLRIDYNRTGDAKTDVIAVDKLYRYGIWAGSKVNTIDKFNNGKNYVEIKDAASGKVIFSRGFDTLFGEYQTTDPAIAGIKKTFQESVLIPNPKKKVVFTFSKRNKAGKLQKIFETTIDPESVSIISESISDPSAKVVNASIAGDPHQKVDVVILGDGYAKGEFGKFKKDLDYFTKVFFEQEPFASQKDKFNVYGVFKPSLESGTDEPTAGIYKNTVLNSSFNTLGSERYLMTEDNKAMRDLAAHVPYDAIYLMVNSKRYGGGGIYNQYATFTTGNQWKEYVFLHEFGHHFTGLADEYYTSQVEYNDFYPKGIEPTEPNITALLNRKNLKWKALATEGIAIPTPWEKSDFDKQDMAWLKVRNEMVGNIDKLKKARAPQQEIDKAQADYDAKDREHNQQVKKYLGGSKFAGMVGAFEGAGYSAKGLYRPMPDCIMFSKGHSPFCKVCAEAIKRMIAYFGE